MRYPYRVWVGAGDVGGTVILTFLHVMQWIFIGICAPLLGLLLYALFREWKVRVTTPDCTSEYTRGYEDGMRDGYDAGLLARVMDASWFEDTPEETDD